LASDDFEFALKAIIWERFHNCTSLCSDLFVLVFSFLAFSALALAFHWFAVSIACRFLD